MAKNNGDFGGHQGCEKSRSRNLVLEPKLRLYKPLRGRNTCRTWIFQPRELNLRCFGPGSPLTGPIFPGWPRRGSRSENNSKNVMMMCNQHRDLRGASRAARQNPLVCNTGRMYSLPPSFSNRFPVTFNSFSVRFSIVSLSCFFTSEEFSSGLKTFRIWAAGRWAIFV